VRPVVEPSVSDGETEAVTVRWRDRPKSGVRKADVAAQFAAAVA
jgi:hypothetical protein